MFCLSALVIYCLRRYVMICLYKQLFCPFSTTDEDKDLEIQAKIRSVKNVM